MKKYCHIVLIVVLSIILLAPFLVICYSYYQSYSIILKSTAFDPPLSTKIFDVNGELISELFDENRSIIPFEEVPDVVKQSFLISEDHDYFSHYGFDVYGILRALIINVFRGEVKQGGSTITQQLVKQLHFGGERAINRKIIELFLAIQMENRYSKNKIFEMYLNQIYFGSGVYGIESASKFYFNKNIKDVTLIEAVLLSIIPSSPNQFSPIKNPRLAFNKHRIVLSNLIRKYGLENKTIEQEFVNFWNEYLVRIRRRYPNVGIRNKRYDRAPYFTEYIRKALLERFDENQVYRGGLTVYTTLDLRYQKIAEKILKKAISEQNAKAEITNNSRLNAINKYVYEKKARNIADAAIKNSYIRCMQNIHLEIADELSFLSLLSGVDTVATSIESSQYIFNSLYKSAQVEGALIAIDAHSGSILVMIGGSEFNKNNQLNRTVNMVRQPGSAFKAIVYAAGIELKKITAATCYNDAPIIFKGSRTLWTPSNYDRSFLGKVLVRRALALSINVVSVLIVDDIGAKEVAQVASQLLGIPIQRFSIDPSLSLGTSEVSPLEMTKGMAIIANNGYDVCPYSIIRVEKGKMVLHNRSDSQKQIRRIVSPETAFIMTSLLREVVDNGTATSGIRHQAGFRFPAAGKTGTNTNFRDVWFTGFTPDIVASVWIGCDSPKFTLAWGQSASTAAAPIWGSFMREIYTIIKPTQFASMPAGIHIRSICIKSGMLPGVECQTRSEYFTKGTVPIDYCNGDHEEMVSIFELMRKRMNELKEKKAN